MKRLLLLALVCMAASTAACSQRTRPALNLDGNRLTIYNDTDETWSNVEVILNQHFHIQPKDIAPDGIVQAPLDIFVAGYGQRFNFKTMQITDGNFNPVREEQVQQSPWSVDLPRGLYTCAIVGEPGETSFPVRGTGGIDVTL